MSLQKRLVLLTCSLGLIVLSVLYCIYHSYMCSWEPATNLYLLYVGCSTARCLSGTCVCIHRPITTDKKLHGNGHVINLMIMINVGIICLIPSLLESPARDVNNISILICMYMCKHCSSIHTCACVYCVHL